MRIPVAAFRGLTCALIFGLAESALAAPPIESDSFAEVDGLKVHYKQCTEQAKDVLIFVHGWSCDETFWDAQACSFPNHRVIRIDLPGHGQSDKPQIAYTIDSYARAIDAVMQHAKVEKATLIGHSNGTPVIRQFYRKYPAKTRALVIVDGGLRPLGNKEEMEKFIAGVKGPGYAEKIGQLIDSMTSPIQDAALREKIKTAMLKTPQYVGVPEFESTLDEALWKPDKINVPVLMVLAKQPLWSAEYEQFVRGIVPDLDYQVWDGVSHFLMMEQPERFNSALVAFLKKHKL
jgi:pimeloyl-ACP methyl ester carboxylesterase